MAEKEKIVLDDDSDEEEVVGHTTPTTAVVQRRHSQKWVLWVVIIVVLVYLILVVGGIMIFQAIGNHGQNALSNNTTTGQLTRGPRYSNQQTFNVRSDNSDGLTTTSTNTTYTRTEGVVTAVNSGNIVVAGGGKTQTITTNSSTTYDGGTKPAVNDTVEVIGTESGTTITATEVAVLNS
jgi:hypothetical protein